MTSSTYRSQARVHSLPLIRPAWTPATIALMVGGFIVFAPAGLAMLAYIIWGERFHAWRDNGGSIREAMNSKMNSKSASKWYSEHRANGTTGNVAFDDWRNSELDRLAEERRKLDDMREEFDGYARELRRAKDKEEFDRFMAARDATRDATRNAASNAKTVPDVKED